MAKVTLPSPCLTQVGASVIAKSFRQVQVWLLRAADAACYNALLAGWHVSVYTLSRLHS